MRKRRRRKCVLSLCPCTSDLLDPEGHDTPRRHNQNQPSTTPPPAIHHLLMTKRGRRGPDSRELQREPDPRRRKLHLITKRQAANAPRELTLRS